MATILIAEDEDMIRKLIANILNRAGHEVLEARTGQEAIDLYPLSGADLVITDMIMPGKKGAEVIAELLRHSPELRIIAMSGGGRHSPQSLLNTASALGAQRVISKPFGIVEFISAVDEVLAVRV